MPDHDDIGRIKDFESLVAYLRDELDWPFDEDLEIEDLAFDYEPEELGLDKGYEVAVNEIKQIRPASGKLPWGIFYVDFEKKHLPVIVLRRALRALVPKKRASAAAARQATWETDDLLFIAATGEAGSRGISFVHFEKTDEGLPRLKTIAWDERETHFFYLARNISRLSWPDDEDDSEAWRKTWASAFTSEYREVIRTSKELSAELARLSRSTRDLIRRVYNFEAKDGALHKLHESFRTILIEDLDEDGFADMVAQTISYGLFTARATGEEVLGLAHLEAMVPNTNPFLKELFAEFVSMSGSERHQIDFDELGVSELVEMLNEVNVEAVLQDFGRQSGGGSQDPVIYFYEDFLKDYDNAQKVKRGEFYTPKPVVSYIVRSVDRLLRDELDCPDGLADTSTMEWKGETWPKVMILDPATGTGTFLETVIEVIHETMTEKWKKEGRRDSERRAAWNEYVPKHLLPRLHGFELMMAPYSVAHMKLGLKLKETGYEFASDERLRVYLTNTLEEPQISSGRLYADFLAHEAEAANRVKRDIPVTVMIGNPPYSNYGQSNQNPWISTLLDEYKKDLAEKKLNLDDDFIKFIRHAQWTLDRTGIGILAYITSNTFLDGITHRRMRQSLMDSFTDLYFLDLHGSTRRKEQRDGNSKVRNVFDIQQGVAISLAVKQPHHSALSTVRHSNYWGSRQSKYDRLLVNSCATVSWIELKDIDHQSCLGTFYFFTLRAFDNIDEYCAGWSIKEMFIVSGLGIKTERDKIAIHWYPNGILNTVDDFRKLSEKQIREKYSLGKDSRDWKVARAKADVLSFNSKEAFRKIMYRPFDFRHTWYSGLTRGFIGTPGYKAMRHMMSGDNLGLVTSRTVYGSDPWRDILVTQNLVEFGIMATRPGNSAPLFPLYTQSICDTLDAGNEQEANLNPVFVQALYDELDLNFEPHGLGDLRKTVGPEDVLNYIYAILHAATYRDRYAELLKVDFPRLPLTTDLALFRELCGLGKELVSLHLMKSPSLNTPFSDFPKSGSNVMANKATYSAEEQRVYINKEGQYFGNVPEETWNFRVGGYQVLDKWLKDRKGRTLSEEDIEHYRKVVSALYETETITGEIDEVIESHGGWPLAGSAKEESGAEE